MRQDLELKEYAKEKGFGIKEGKSLGDSLTFSKGTWVVWQCIHSGKPSWACAELIEGYHKKHRYSDSLQETLDRVCLASPNN